MTIFLYDHTFDGLLTCLFDAYARKTFPDLLLTEGEPLPLFYDEAVHITTSEEKHQRVWKGLQKKLSPSALTTLTYGWLSELPEVDMLLLRYMKKAIDSPVSIETNFTDADVLELSKVWKKVNWERLRILQFVRFQKAADGTYFAAIEPQHNALPLTIHHFRDRYADQPWLIYDLKRQYGYYYDLKTVEEVTFEDTEQAHFVTGMLNENLMDKDEKFFQQLWKTYFKSTCIKERLNPRKHRQDMPVRYWKYLTEKQ
ncbi:MAG: TIGR03915 family putative DNA repair protein [Bacteroides sp.]|nr:TIGR03915 family putative DNA repair protein [Bacteroides sp.]